MTISTQVTKRIYTGNGENTKWDVDFPLLSADHLQVFLTSPQGVQTRLTEHFRLDLNTHTFIYPTEESGLMPLPAGWTITLLRHTPPTQQVNLLRQGELDAEVLEQAYDKLTLLVQELGEETARSIKYPASMDIPSPHAEDLLTRVLTAADGAQTAASQAEASAKAALLNSRQAQTLAAQAVADISARKQQAEESLSATQQNLSAALTKQGENITASAQTAAELAASYAAQAKAYALRTLGKSLGEVYWSQSKTAADNPGALPLWTGEYIANAGTLYPDFYAWVKSHPELCKTKAQYDEALSAYGECPYYVADEVAGSLRLPKLVNYIKSADETNGITQRKAGLPTVKAISNTAAGNIPDFTSLPPYAKPVPNTQGYALMTGASITGAANLVYVENDASLNSSVYGASETVTPAHTTLYPWVCAYYLNAESADTLQMQEQATGLTRAVREVVLSENSTASEHVKRQARQLENLAAARRSE